VGERIAIVGARDASAELRRIAHALGACHCWDFGCEPADLATILERIHHLSTLTAEKVRIIREMHECSGLSDRKIGKLMGTTGRHVGAIVRREVWKHVA